MISYYASSSEPAQVRGKTVYLQYSNRQEIVNNKTTADVAGNVLLVTIEGNDARLVSIDVLHLVRIKILPICFGGEEIFFVERFPIVMVIRLEYFVLSWAPFNMKLNGSAGQCPGYIFNGSLLHREKERMRVCLLSLFLNSSSFFPSPHLTFLTFLECQMFLIPLKSSSFLSMCIMEMQFFVFRGKLVAYASGNLQWMHNFLCL